MTVFLHHIIYYLKFTKKFFIRWKIKPCQFDEKLFGHKSHGREWEKFLGHGMVQPMNGPITVEEKDPLGISPANESPLNKRGKIHLKSARKLPLPDFLPADKVN